MDKTKCVKTDREEKRVGKQPEVYDGLVLGIYLQTYPSLRKSELCS